jgi:hypothetical protein
MCIEKVAFVAVFAVGVTSCVISLLRGRPEWCVVAIGVMVVAGYTVGKLA